MSRAVAPRPAQPVAPTALPLGWQDEYLLTLEADGGKYRSARKCGVRWRDVLHEQQESPEFQARIEEAMGIFADDIEKKLIDPTNKNVVGCIVLLKKLRPAEFIEKQAGIAIQVNATNASIGGVSEEDAKALLRTMLAHASPHALAKLTAGTGG